MRKIVRCFILCIGGCIVLFKDIFDGTFDFDEYKLAAFIYRYFQNNY